jgi:hypothetical protein
MGHHPLRKIQNPISIIKEDENKYKKKEGFAGRCQQNLREMRYTPYAL